MHRSGQIEKWHELRETDIRRRKITGIETEPRAARITSNRFQGFLCFVFRDMNTENFPW